ncbi:MAG: response regulator [Planctomycetaceae bacterium]|nr:response regulator [Planctomycetaceae bacterium]
MKPKQVLTSGEVAKLCNVNFRTVLRWIERGDLPAYKLPGRGDNRIRVEDFMEFVSAHQLPVPPEFVPNRRRVLVIDDEAHMARSIRRVLKNQGFECKIANDGFRAGTYLGTYAPALVTLDLQMPGLTGYDVLSFIRQTEELRRIRILVISGMDEASLRTAIDEGADAVLAKPFENSDLIAKVNELLSEERVHSEYQLA